MKRPAGLLSRLSRLLSWGAVCFLAWGLIRYSRQTAESAWQGLTLCARTLVPVLFPFFAASSLAVSTGLAGLIGRWLEKPMQALFRLPGACASAFALGLAGGYPVGAGAALSLYRQKLCGKEEAQRLLAFCNNCGPAFILGAAGAAAFGSAAAGGLLYGCHVLASLLTGLLFRFYGRRAEESAAAGRREETEKPFGAALTESVRSAASSVVNVSAFVVFFTVFIRLLTLTGLLPALAGLLLRLGVEPSLAQPLAGGFFEMSGGVMALAGPASPARLAAAAFLLAWGGLSVHCQTLSLLAESDLSAGPYLAGKLLQGLLAAGLTYWAAGFAPFAQATVKTGAPALTVAGPIPPAGQAALAGLAVFGLVLRRARRQAKKRCQRPRKPV